MTSNPTEAASFKTIDAGTLSASAGLSGGLWSDVWKRFQRNPIALAGFYVVCFLVFIALFADFIANDKPYYLEYRGKTYFPILRSYIVDVDLGR
jgi:ABC-type microcin C transport system permease subunit YejE